jgi:hypothetical protein
VKSRLYAVGLLFAVAAALVSFVVLRAHDAPATARSSVTVSATAPAPITALGPVPPSDPAGIPGGCGADPHACGFPDATNTGPPVGMTLKTVPGQVSSGPGWYYDPSGWVEVDGNGAVLSGLYIPCNVNVTASNVIIEDDAIVVSGQQAGVSLRHTSTVTIEDSDIYSPYAGADRLMTGIKDVYGDSTGLQILGDNIWHTATGVQVESGLIQNSYIHDPGYRSGDHTNGITSNGGRTALLTVRHNTIFIDRSQTDAIGLFEDFGVQANRVITNNLLAGGGYTIYAGQNPGQQTAYNIQITNNQISQIYYPDGGYYGHVDLFNPDGSGNLWAGNSWSSNSSRESAGAIAGP